MATMPAPFPADDEPAGGEAVQMDDTELVSILKAHETQSVGYFDGEIADEQAAAINYYYGRMDDVPAPEGGSRVVDHTVAVMVDNALAAIIKPFVSADEVVSFEPRGPEDMEIAAQATEYVNYVVNCDNDGFLIFHHWFKDALLTKLGIVKTWWEDQSREDVQQAVVTADQLLLARGQPGYAGEQDNGDGTFTLSMRQTIPDGRVKIENIPPEEFLITPFARCIKSAPYVAHRPNNFTRSDLLEMGIDPDVVDGLPAHTSDNDESSRRDARYADEDFGDDGESMIGSDRSRDIVAVLDEYVRLDYNGDGVSELRRIVRVDDMILLNEEVDDNPFAILCPVPMPHKVYGRSVADQAMEPQRIATAIKRQTLDNLYKSNNPRPIVPQSNETVDTMDDLADTAPGAAIRTKNTGLDFMVVPFSAQYSMPIMEMVAREAEERTGFQRKGMGFNADALEKNSPNTATQAAIDENSRNERAELIARIFAETGVKRLFKLVLGLLVKHQPQARIIRLRNKFVEMDPSGWSPEMDLSISVGLGIGNKAEQMQQAQAILEIMERLGATPFGNLISPPNVHEAVKRFLTSAGVKNVDDFIQDPANMPPEPPKPDPEMVKVQAEAQLKAQEQKAKFVEKQFDAQLRERDQMHKQAMDRFKVENDAALSRMRAEFEARLAESKAQFEASLALQKAAYERQMKADLHDNRPGGDLDK